MGILSGPITYLRFRAEGDLPDNYRERFLQAVNDRAHRDIDPDSDDERAIGWAVADDVGDANITMEKLFLGDTLVLMLRVDTLKVSPRQLQLYLRPAEREFLKATGKEKLSKRDKDEIRERVVGQLRRRILPKVDGFDLAWSIGEGVVRFSSTSRTLADELIGLFFDTFGIRLLPWMPILAGRDLGLDEVMLRVEPADFTVAACEVA